MVDEMQSNFRTLMSQYPSGMRVNSLIAAKNFDLDAKNVVVGNGAAELIKSLMEQNTFEKVGFIRPTFEEYPNRFYKEAVIMTAEDNDFSYDENTIMTYYNEHPVDALVIINPDNPTGNYITVDGLLALINWSKEKGITLIVDESFVDFVHIQDEEKWEDYSLLKDDILRSYENLYVVKSISKSYGVPGFRLGIVASSNEAMIAKMKKDVAIWNINSYGEFFMQILEKYKKDYAASLKKIKAARDVLIKDLSSINGIHVYPSQANYVMCKLTTDKLNSRELAVQLLDKNIYIKDLTSKINDGNQYIRLAVRDKKDNAYLVEELKNIFK